VSSCVVMPGSVGGREVDIIETCHWRKVATLIDFGFGWQATQ
jgi:hypothetical protein